MFTTYWIVMMPAIKHLMIIVSLFGVMILFITVGLWLEELITTRHLKVFSILISIFVVLAVIIPGKDELKIILEATNKFKQ